MNLMKEMTKQLLTEMKLDIQRGSKLQSPNVHYSNELRDWHKTNVSQKWLNVHVFHCYLGQYQNELSSQTDYDRKDEVLNERLLGYVEKMVRLIEGDNLKLVRFEPTDSNDAHYYLLPSKKTSKYVKLINKVLG